MNTHAVIVAAADWTEIAAIAQAASAAIAVFALLAVSFQLLQNRRQVRATRAYQYLERYSAPSEIVLNARFHEFIKVEPSAHDRERLRWESMSAEERSQVIKLMHDRRSAHWESLSTAKHFEILHALNFWEELAGMYRRRLVDRRIVRDYFASGALAYWDWAQWFIEAESRRMTFPYAIKRRRRVNR